MFVLSLSNKWYQNVELKDVRVKEKEDRQSDAENSEGQSLDKT